MQNEPVVTSAAMAPAHASRSGSSHEPVPAHELTLREIGYALANGKWVILAAIVLAMGVALAYLFLATPVWRATALVQVEDASGTLGLEGLTKGVDVKSSTDGEIEIMRSRMVLAPVVDELALDVVAEPRHFPFLGDALARRHRGGHPAKPLLRELSRFAWGGERIAVGRLDVSSDLVDVPLSLVTGEAGRYRVVDPAGSPLLEGRVGEPATADAGGRHVALLVTDLQARPGTEFRIERRSRDAVMDDLQAALTVEERGKTSGVVGVDLDGRDPVRAAAVVSSLASVYVRQNVERRSAEAAKSLEFVESQLPGVKRNLETAEAALTKFRVANGTVDLPLETTAMVERVAALDREVSTITADLTQLRQRYGDIHPDLVALQRKLDAVRAERTALDAQLRALPGSQLTAARLTRQVTVATELYTLLLDRAQALRVVKSGTIGNVRVVDRPFVARQPVRPRPAPVLVIALLVGLGGGVAVALSRRTLHEGTEDPQDVERATGMPVLVSIPHSEREHVLSRSRSGRLPLAEAAPDDVATEQLRTLRTVLGFLSKARGNVVAFSSPSPGVGKTFVCTNIAQLAASAGKRVLLVDADLRRGAIHRLLGIAAEPGLSEVLGGGRSLEEAIRSGGAGGPDILTRGAVPDRPAELLAGSRLHEVVAAAATRYDLVVIDSPPSLAVTDPVLVARCANVNLLVLRAGEHPIREISLAVERFARSGVGVQGAILNDVRPAPGGYARIYEHHRSTS